MTNQLTYPTKQHQEVAQIVLEFFASSQAVDTVLMLNSCARGKATKKSDLDIGVLLKSNVPDDTAKQLEQAWLEYATINPDIQRFRQISPFTGVHLDMLNGRFIPQVWDDGGGPDGFELEIGNHVAYSVPLGEIGEKHQSLREEWLPFYNDGLRKTRANMVKQAALYDLAYIPYLIERGLLFQAFDRLYKAEQEFIQLLMITHQRYPIAYNKWIEEQLVEWLGLADLFAELQTILTIETFDGVTLNAKAALLAQLVEGGKI